MVPFCSQGSLLGLSDLNLGVDSFGVLVELFNEAWIRIYLSLILIYLSPPASDGWVHLRDGIVVLSDQVGDDYGHAPTDPCETVDQNIGLFSGLINEIESLVEMHTEVIILVVVGF